MTVRNTVAQKIYNIKLQQAINIFNMPLRVVLKIGQTMSGTYVRRLHFSSWQHILTYIGNVHPRTGHKGPERE